ncbi:MAG: site-specific integrase [Deltaproteobacteria bacterium]|nr:site-specific integrase [Deltaproteobacteria bacterium]
MSKRIKTVYPGVFFREAERIGGRGTERVYYIVFKKEGKVSEEKVGRQFADDMTPAKAARIRAERIENKRKSRKELREEEKARKEADLGKWTLCRIFDEYLKTRPDNKGKCTDQNRFDLYLSELGKKEPHEILPLDVDRIRLKLLKKKSPQTVAHVLNLLTWTINFGHRRNYCAGLPFKIKKPTVDNLKTEDLTPEQINALFQAMEVDCNQEAAALMRLALFTGMRRGELFKLKWEDVDFHRGFISIRNPKGGRDAKIPLNEVAREVLNSIPETESEYVFPGLGGGQRVSFTKAVNRIKKVAGLPSDLRPLHGLRHVFASMLASSGQVDLYTLQRLLTHKDPRMTQRYAHLRDETLKRASNVATDILTTISKQPVDKMEHREF